jgi:tRNA1(Val) A37 N6-methylase TrmN6
VVTEDAVLNGRVRLLQPRRGYRAGLDAALLAAACGARPGERVLEAGCGVGAALLAAASRAPEAAFVGLERDPEAARLAWRNIGLNGMEDRVEAIQADLLVQPFSKLGLRPFDRVMANPPFFDDPEALRGPAPERRGAWIADGGLAAWTRFLLKSVREGGRILVIHRADRLADLLALLGQGAGSFAIRPIHPFAEAPAKRVLIQAIKAGRAPLKMLPPLVLHPAGAEAKHSAQAEAILRGETALDWD